MNRMWIAVSGVAVLAVSAFSIYIDQGSERKNVSTAKQEAVFSMLAKRAALPDVRFTDGDGRSVRLSGFRGKTILLNIWATWCAPCRKEMPALERLQAKLGGPAFEVVALSIDRGGATAVKSFYEELGIKDLRVYVDATAQAPSEFNAIGLPTTLLIDAQGREIGRKVGPAEWDSPEVVRVIQKYLETPTASGRR
jgi:thiol-disulfide isomerase/thioredoxin